MHQFFRDFPRITTPHFVRADDRLRVVRKTTHRNRSLRSNGENGAFLLFCIEIGLSLFVVLRAVFKRSAESRILAIEETYERSIAILDTMIFRVREHNDVSIKPPGLKGSERNAVRTAAIENKLSPVVNRLGDIGYG